MQDPVPDEVPCVGGGKYANYYSDKHHIALSGG
jgi:hypothetical protein